MPVSQPPDGVADASARLEAAVLEACARHAEWPAKVAAGIYAALDRAVADPAAARILAIEPPLAETEERRRYARSIDRFAELLAAAAPREQRHPVSNDRALVRALVTMVADHVRAGKLQRLPEIGPELVQLALLPYLGFAEAQLWAQRTERPEAR